jgi:hypothetical protein
MAERIRRLALGLVACATLGIQAVPARAAGERFDPDSVPVVRDTYFRFFVGIPATVGGFLGFCVSSPFLAVTRPTEFRKLWNALVVTPVKFTWVDPLGRHPERPDSGFGDTTAATNLQTAK